MSQPKEPMEAKLFVGFLFCDKSVQRLVLEALSERFGPMDFLAAPERFLYTTYYDKEMGPGIHWQCGSFLQLVHPETLPDIKLFTNQLELLVSRPGGRQVNIDPGLLSEERFILATGKNYTHRIYLRDGIYADLTLIYQKGAFRILPWTYPNYQAPAMLHILDTLRTKLIFQRTGKLPRSDMHKGGTS